MTFGIPEKVKNFEPNLRFLYIHFLTLNFWCWILASGSPYISSSFFSLRVHNIRSDFPTRFVPCFCGVRLQQSPQKFQKSCFAIRTSKFTLNTLND